MRTRAMKESLHGPWPGDCDGSEIELAALRDDFGHTHRVWRAMAADQTLKDWCAQRIRPRGDDGDQITESTAKALRERLRLEVES